MFTNIKKENSGDLYIACLKGNLKKIKSIIDKGNWYKQLFGGNINGSEDSDFPPPLITCANSGRMEVMQLLLDRGADLNVKDNSGQTALYEAIRLGHMEIAQFFITKGCKVSQSELRIAAAQGLLKIVQQIIEKGVNVNVIDPSHKVTPLYIAAE